MCCIVFLFHSSVELSSYCKQWRNLMKSECNAKLIGTNNLLWNAFANAVANTNSMLVSWKVLLQLIAYATIITFTSIPLMISCIHLAHQIYGLHHHRCHKERPMGNGYGTKVFSSVLFCDHHKFMHLSHMRYFYPQYISKIDYCKKEWSILCCQHISLHHIYHKEIISFNNYYRWAFF